MKENGSGSIVPHLCRQKRQERQRRRTKVGTDTLANVQERARSERAERRRMDWMVAGVFAKADARTRGFVYFAESGPFVKIGYSFNARERVRRIHTCSPYAVKLIGLLVGGTELEAELHKDFAGSHFRNEWFHLTDDVRQRITALVGEWEHLDRPAPNAAKSLRDRYLRE